jgi:hypothetical protein
VTVVNLPEIRIRGGCMGCLQCGLDNECVYRDKDEIRETYERLKAADVVILAGAIRDRYLSWRWRGIVIDECTEAPRLDRLLDCLAVRLAASAATGYLAPDTFLGVAGRKIFRDEIWGDLRMVFHAVYRYYRSRGLYDFPRRSLGDMRVNARYKLPGG